MNPRDLNVSTSVALLVPGTNCLALQVHNARSVTAGLCVSAELFANFNRAPYLQNMSSNQVQIIWKTPVQLQLELGSSPGLVAFLTPTWSRRMSSP